ncbi:uncharacterized protein CC84DRAFT_619942 [Paraphaeosphaeria sporulosa]|uniref:Uncharacterized protein n=1 Tax=Paraphaeosphaeria sporulosa TaxID=1460663 RepID=A0A177CIC7_9PLEO|nr:uncharacterized protein CC84DRAFT_619942 [Paraphaeosphaeria sporulosa]OAG06732.1 hypothetical protein CC84DRAFT_619942 [Paraphaeosphaeria sporulosa]
MGELLFSRCFCSEHGVWNIGFGLVFCWYPMLLGTHQASRVGQGRECWLDAESKRKPSCCCLLLWTVLAWIHMSSRHVLLVFGRSVLVTSALMDVRPHCSHDPWWSDFCVSMFSCETPMDQDFRGTLRG